MSTGHRTQTPYNVYMEVDTQKMGFQLLDQDGVLGYRASLADSLVPQVNQSGYDYQADPIEISLAVPFESFTGGCAFNSVEYEESGSLTKYSFSRGVDASYPGKLYAGPFINYDTETSGGTTGLFSAGDDATPMVKFFYSVQSATIFAFGGQYLYKYDGNNTWTLMFSFIPGYAIVDIQDFNNTLFLTGMNTTSEAPLNYYYSSDYGTSWTQSTLANSAFKFLAIRGESSGSGVLWGVTGTGALRTNTDGTNTGGAWSNAIQMGSTYDDVVKGLVVAGNYVYVSKANSLWRTDGQAAEAVFVETQNKESWHSAAASGSSPYVWTADNHLYVQYGRRILRHDPIQNTMSIAWPPSQAQIGSEELDGQVTGIAGDGSWVYFSLVNKNGVSYIMKLDPITAQAHTYTFTQYHKIKGIGTVGGGLMGTNPMLLFGTDATGTGAESAGRLGSIILPQVGSTPDIDPNYLFDVTYDDQYIVGPWNDIGQGASEKILNGARLQSTLANASSPTTVSYLLDGSGYTDTFVQNSTRGAVTGTTLFTAVDDYASHKETSEVRFNKIRWIVKMTRSTPKNVASINSLVFDTSVAAPRRRIFEMDIRVGDDQDLRGGGNSRWAAEIQENFLFRNAPRLIKFYDPYGRQFNVKMIDLKSGGVMMRDSTPVQVYSVRLAEINELSAVGDDLIWDVSAWDTGRIWS